MRKLPVTPLPLQSAGTLTVGRRAAVVGLAVAVACPTTPRAAPHRTTPEDFGAIGDGRADDAGALNAALAAAPHLRLTSNARYLLRSPLRLPHGTRLFSDGTATVVRGSDGPLLHASGTSDIMLADFQIDGMGDQYFTPDNAEILVDWRARKGRDVTIRNVRITDASSDGIIALASSQTKSNGVRISRCSVRSAGAHGIITQDYIDDVEIIDCLVTSTGIRVADRPGITASRNGKRVRIYRNVCIGSKAALGRSVHGISLDMSTDAHAIDNICRGWTGFGLEVAGVKGADIRRNTLQENTYGIGGSGYGSRFWNNDVWIRENLIINSLECGIYFFISAFDGTHTHQRITISDNRVTGATGTSIGVGEYLSRIEDLRIIDETVSHTSRAGIMLLDCNNVTVSQTTLTDVNRTDSPGQSALVAHNLRGSVSISTRRGASSPSDEAGER